MLFEDVPSLMCLMVPNKLPKHDQENLLFFSEPRFKLFLTPSHNVYLHKVQRLSLGEVGWGREV